MIKQSKNTRFLVLFFLLFLTLSTPVFGYDRKTPIVEAFNKTKDAVVNISTKYVVETRNQFYNYWGFDDFFYLPPRRRELSSLGSGFVIDSRGYIITNAHVVNRATEITVIMADEQEYMARLIAMDSSNDIALLKIDAPQPLTSVIMGYSHDLMIGETALAIGNPMGYQHTLTDGIVSAIHRDLEFRDNLALGDLIQISTPINPGNSGGPLLNINGELIGINTAINKAAQGIGFAIPVDRLKQVLPQMLDIDALYRIDFGANVGPIPMTQKDDSPKPGAMIQFVRAESQAHKNGLQIGDIITKVNKQEINTPIDFSLELLEQSQNDKLKLTILRKIKNQTKQKTISMALEKRPKPEGDFLAQQLFGIELGILNKAMIQRYDIHGKPGDLVVLSVDRRSTADIEGVEPGDVLVGIGDKEISNMDQLGLLLEEAQTGQRVSFVFNRSKQAGFRLRVYQYQITLQAQTSGNIQRKTPQKIEL